MYNNGFSLTQRGSSFYETLNTKHRRALYLGPIQVVRLYIGWLVSLRLLGEGNGCAYKAEESTKDSYTKRGKALNYMCRHVPSN